MHLLNQFGLFQGIPRLGHSHGCGHVVLQEILQDFSLIGFPDNLPELDPHSFHRLDPDLQLACESGSGCCFCLEKFLFSRHSNIKNRVAAKSLIFHEMGNMINLNKSAKVRIFQIFVKYVGTVGII